DQVLTDTRSSEAFVGTTPVGKRIPVLELVVVIVVEAPAGAELQSFDDIRLSVDIPDVAGADGVHVRIINQHIEVIKARPLRISAICIELGQISRRMQGRLKDPSLGTVAYPGVRT